MAQAGWRIDDTLSDPLEIAGEFDAPELSDLAYDINSNTFLAVSDKQRTIYSLQLNDSDLPATVTLTGQQALLTKASKPLKARTDFEGIGVFPDGERLLGSEHDQSLHRVNSSGVRLQKIRAINRLGFNRFAYPKSNKGIEGLAIDNLGVAWVINEESLKFDEGARFTRLQALNQKLHAGPQWAYPLSTDTGLFGSYGISGLEALPDGKLLVLERKARFDLRYAGPAMSHEIYLISPNPKAPRAGENVRDKINLAEAEFIPLNKTLLWQGSYARLNFEGIAIGKQRGDGSYPLLLVSDDGQGLKAGALLLELINTP